MPRALVVDDEMDICTLLTRQLDKFGLQSTYSLTIRDALEKISVNPYDVIFVDLNLSDGSGYDLIASIASKDEKALVVVISAYDSERQKAMQAGANLFVPKPFNNKSIQDTLRRLNFLNEKQFP